MNRKRLTAIVEFVGFAIAAILVFALPILLKILLEVAYPGM